MEENTEAMEQQQDAQEPQQPHEDPQIKERALIQGWVDKPDFRGDPSRWIPADEFVKRADNMMPILKSVNRKLETKLTDVERRLQETQETLGKMSKVQNKYSTDAYDQRVHEIRRQKREAAQAGNLDLYDTLEQQERTISKPETVEVKPPENRTNAVHPDVARWQGENAWYTTDAELTEYTDIIADKLNRQGATFATPYDFCQEVGKKVRAMFPQKFRNPNRQRTDMDESDMRGGDIPSNGKKKGWNDLPQEARDQCNGLMKQIPGYSKERYIQDYFEGA